MAFGLSAGTLLTAGSAIAGGIAGAQKKGGGTTTTTSTPWEPQQQYLKAGFQGAQDAYSNANRMGAFTGPRVAGLNPFQTSGADFTGGFASGFGQQGANALGASGLSLLGAGGGFGGNYNDIYGRASMDPTQSIINSAGQFANNPYVDGMIDAANRDTVRGLTEQQLPALMRGMVGTGGVNSTAGMKEGQILTRGAQDRMADTANTIRSQLFGRGLDMSQNQYNQNLVNMMNANAGLRDAFTTGGNTIINGQQAAGNVFDQMQAAGGVYQGQDQRMLDANMAQFNEQRDLPQQFASNFMKTVGGNYGGTQTSTAPQTGGGLGGFLTGALGGASAGFGMAGKLGGFGSGGGGWGGTSLAPFFYGSGTSGD